VALARNALLAPVVRWASRRRFPVLFALMLVLLVVNVVVPDPLPFVDEALLALGALLVGRLRKGHRAGDEPPDG